MFTDVYTTSNRWLEMRLPEQLLQLCRHLFTRRDNGHFHVTEMVS